MRDYIREHPYYAIILAFAIGTLLAKFFVGAAASMIAIFTDS